MYSEWLAPFAFAFEILERAALGSMLNLFLFIIRYGNMSFNLLVGLNVVYLYDSEAVCTVCNSKSLIDANQMPIADLRR